MMRNAAKSFNILAFNAHDWIIYVLCIFFFEILRVFDWNNSVYFFLFFYVILL